MRNASVPFQSTPGPSTRPEPQAVKITSRKKKKQKQKKYKQLLEQVRGCDVLSELANASCGLTFGQLLRGDANAASSSPQRFLSRTGRAVNRAAVTRTGSHRLKIVAANVYGTDTQFICDSGSIQNVMSASLARSLSITPEPTDRGVSILDGKRSDSVRGFTENVPVSFDDLSFLITFLVVAEFPYDILVGLPE